VADEQLEHSVAELEEGITLASGKEYEVTELVATGKLRFVIKDEEGVEPLPDTDFTLKGAEGFEHSAKTDADGAYEHADPVAFGDYDLEVGQALRRLQAVNENSPPQVVSIGGEEREDPYDPPGSDEDEEEEQEDEVPLVEIMAEGGREAAPDVLDVGVALVLEAVPTPSDLTGTWEWSCENDKVSLTPVEGCPHQATLTCDDAEADGEEITVKAKLTPEREGVAESDDEHPMTIRRQVVEVFFQRSPGKVDGDVRGISGLDYRVVAGGREVQTGTTGEDGKIEAICIEGEATLELLWEGNPVASYALTAREEEWEEVTTLTGQQRRLNLLGYQLGGGTEGTGVDGEMGKRTDRAILDFQIDQKINHDGVVGDTTRTKLTEAAGE